ncbi:MAG: cysteine--tRNA ligase [Pseudomonadota bacterium]
MSIKIYNTLSRSKEEFTPINDGKVRMYVCGVTVYDSSHLGHIRPAVVFDMVYRYLKFKGFDVTYVRNYTDIDDKIIKRANELKISCEELTKKYIAEYEQEMSKLKVLPPSVSPKATEHVKDMIEMIEKLEKNGLAYRAGNDVYYAVRKFPGYGKLSGRNIEELESGTRIEVDEKKDDPLDFALWKGAKPDEPSWESPWGKGRPGWHIECSCMSTKYLGQPFDIHGGGQDLVFPHHENEIAQAEGANSTKFAKCWMHNGLIKVNGEKMSKSLGNFTTIDSLLAKHDPEILRYFILSTHYRSPLDYTEGAMQQATTSLDRFYDTLLRLPHKTDTKIDFKPSSDQETEIFENLSAFESRFIEAMDDDFNSAKAIGFIFDTMRIVNRHLDSNPNDTKSTNWIGAQMTKIQNMLGKTLGCFGSNPNEYKERRMKFETEKKGVDTKKIEKLIQDRLDARKNKDFAKADQIRDELANLGIKIKDKPDGTTEWSV